MMAARALFRGECGDEENSEIKRKQELDRMEIRMKTRYGEIRRADKRVLHACDCSAAIHVATSNDPNTRGKLYFSCPYEISNDLGQGCGFRRWWIPAVCDEFGKIKDEKNEMKKELDAAKKRIEDHEVTIFEMELQMDELIRGKEKEKDETRGEPFDAGLAVVHLMEKRDELEKKYEALSKKYETLNKYL